MAAPTVDQLRPMLAMQSPVKAFTDPDWLYEIKFDGYRCLAGIAKEDGFVPQSDADRRLQVATRVLLRTKAGTDCAPWYVELLQPLAALPGGPHVIDGEVCVLDELGRSSFEKLQARSRRRRWYPGCDAVTYCAFDLLVHDGRDITALPLLERKARLAALLVGTERVLVVRDLPAEVDLFAAFVLPLQLEGFVAKRKDSLYQPGLRSTDWRKVKRAGAIPPQRFKR